MKDEEKQEEKQEVKQPQNAIKSYTEGDRIWKEVSEYKLNMFSLPGQLVKNHVKRMVGSDLLLTLNSPAVLPALEEALATEGRNKYVMEQHDRYIVIKKNEKKADEGALLGQFVVSVDRVDTPKDKKDKK